MPTTAASGYLRLEEAAAELGLPDVLDVARLTATQRLKSARIPKRGDRAELSEIRVPASGLAEFIAGGCPGLPAPAISPESGTFVYGRIDELAESFVASVRDALPAAGPTDADLQRQAAAADALEIIVSANAAALASLLKAPPPRSVMPDAEPAPFTRWADHAAAVALRDEVRRAIGREQPGRLPLAALFASVVDFQRVTAAAYDAIRSRAISTTRNVRVRGQREIVRDVPATLSLPLSAFLPPLATLRLLAF